MSTPHDVISELLSPAQAAVIDAATRQAWEDAAGALQGIFESAPALEGVEARLVMPDEVGGQFSHQHLVLPVEATTSDDAAATAWLVVATTEAARFLRSEADNPDDQEQQTIVMASTVFGQAIRAVNHGTFEHAPNGLVVAVDDVAADAMPAILETVEDPCLVLKAKLSHGTGLALTMILPGPFLDLVSAGYQLEPGTTGEVEPEDADAPAGRMNDEEATAAHAGGHGTTGGGGAIAESEVLGGRRDTAAEPSFREPTPIGAAPTAHRAQFAPLIDAGGAGSRANIDLLAGLEMNVSVELGRTDMTVADVLSLGPGSVVELDRLAGEPVDILVNDRLIARGEVVVVDENFGVRVVEVLRRGREEAAS